MHQAPDLDVVLAGELLPTVLEEHLSFPVEPNLDGSSANAAAFLPQVHLGRLPPVEKLSELVRELLPAERVGGDVEDELEVLDVAALLFRRR